MSPTKKTAGKAAGRTTRRATTRRTAGSTRRRTSTTRRRTTSTRRRTQPKLATTVGAALGTLAVSLLLDASWPVRIGLVLLVLVLVGGYLYVQGRRHDAAEPPAPAVAAPPADPPSDPPADSPAPTDPPNPASEDTP